MTNFILDRFRSQQVTDDELLMDLRRVAEAREGSLSMPIYRELGRHSDTTFVKRFGSWNEALALVGIKKKAVRGLTETELLANIESLWLQLGRQPRKSDLNTELSRCGENPYRRVFGNWKVALERFVQIANGEIPDTIARFENTKSLNANNLRKTPKNSQQHQAEVLVKIPTRETKRDPNLRLRWEVYKRDNFKCVSCGRSPALNPGVVLHVDHIQPWSKGGKTVIDNLQLLCDTCNLGKGNTE